MCFWGKLSIFSCVFYFFDRVMTGVIQCQTLGCLPW